MLSTEDCLNDATTIPPHENGLYLNLSKCRLLKNVVKLSYVSPLDQVPTSRFTDGSIVLGTPVGVDESVADIMQALTTCFARGFEFFSTSVIPMHHFSSSSRVFGPAALPIFSVVPHGLALVDVTHSFTGAPAARGRVFHRSHLQHRLLLCQSRVFTCDILRQLPRR